MPRGFEPEPGELEITPTIEVFYELGKLVRDEMRAYREKHGEYPKMLIIGVPGTLKGIPVEYHGEYLERGTD